MSMCNLLKYSYLLEYSDKYSITSGSLWNYFRDEVNYAANSRINSNKTKASKSFKYKTKTPVNASRLDTEIVASLKYFSNFLNIFETNKDRKW